MSRRGAQRTAIVLGELEERVLEFLWKTKEADVQETHAAIGRRRGITANTVGSALDRLHKKGFVSRKKVSHAYRYTASVDRDGLRAARVLEAAGGVRALSNEGVLAAFVDLVAETDEGALSQLEALIAERRKRQDPK